MKINIQFVFDGTIVEPEFSATGLTPTTTVLKYLRSMSQYKGVKEGCGEGDCGACTVVLAEAVDGKMKYYAVDSCLVFLPMLHKKQLITVENIAFPDGSLHPVQQAMIDSYGSQCGFCTPGFIMTLFSLYKNHQTIDEKILKEALSGNLCRCTGYQPIIDAGLKILNHPQPDHFTQNETEILRLLGSIDDTTPVCIETAEQKYIKVFNKTDAVEYKEKFPEAKLLCGATDMALQVTKKHALLPEIIDISDCKDLKYNKETDDAFLIGSCSPVSMIKDFTEKKLPNYFEILSHFGSPQIRNLASIGGNIGSASPIGDLLPLLLASEAVFVLENKKGTRKIPADAFFIDYRKTGLASDEIILAVEIPKKSTNEICKSYKISKRKNLDISTCSASFVLELTKEMQVKKICIAMGGMAAIPKRAYETEKFLHGKKWCVETLKESINMLREEFVPISDTRSGKEFRSLVSGNLLMKFFMETSENRTHE